MPSSLGVDAFDSRTQNSGNRLGNAKQTTIEKRKRGEWRKERRTKWDGSGRGELSEQGKGARDGMEARASV